MKERCKLVGLDLFSNPSFDQFQVTSTLLGQGLETGIASAACAT